MNSSNMLEVSDLMFHYDDETEIPEREPLSNDSSETSQEEEESEDESTVSEPIQTLKPVQENGNELTVQLRTKIEELEQKIMIIQDLLKSLGLQKKYDYLQRQLNKSYTQF